MSTAKPNPIIRFFPSLTDAAFLMPIFFLFLKMEGASRLLEGDTGWHIRAGEWMIANGRVPDKDLFSFTKPGEPWFAWEWLWDVIFAWLHMQWGMAAVVLASLFVICLTFALLFRLCLRKCDNVFIAFAVTWLATAASSIHWWARPHVFTMLFAVIFYSILERVRDGRTRLLWILPPLTILWTNLHGGFFVGILFLAAYAGGELIAAAIEPEPENRVRALRRSAPYVVTGFGCFLASFVNPYFYQLHIHIFRYLTEEYHFRVISEFQSANFHPAASRYFEALIVMGLFSVAWHLSRRRFACSLLTVGWLHLALVSARNIPLYVIAVAPVVSLAVYEMVTAVEGGTLAGWCKRAVRSFQTAAAEFGETDRIGRLHVTSLLAAALLAMVVAAPEPSARFKPEYDPKSYPAKAADKLAGDQATRVFTDDEWGDYVIYRLYPATKVFVDGRSDFYGGTFGNTYLNTMNVRYDWESNLSRYNIDTVLLRVDAPLAGAIKESRRWRSVYDDGQAIIFRSAAALTQAPSLTSSIVTGGGKSRGRVVTSINGDRDRSVAQPHVNSKGETLND